MRGQISRFAMHNRRFAAFLKGSPPETYTKTAGIYHELSSVEKRIDWHISLLRTDEFKETECIGDIFRCVPRPACPSQGACKTDLAACRTRLRARRFLAQYEHLASTYFGETDHDLGVRQLDLVLGFDFDLDNFAAAVGFAKQVIVMASQDPGACFTPSQSFSAPDADVYQALPPCAEVTVDTGGLTLEESIYAPIQHLLDLVKSVKLASKCVLVGCRIHPCDC